MKETKTPMYIGIDVSKANLDVAVRPTSEAWQVSNDLEEIDHFVEKVRQMAPGLIVLEATGGNGSYGGMILGEAGTFCLLGIGLIFYLALPIWGGVRASRSGHPGWAAVAILSIFIGLGPIGGILALTACVEPALRASPKTLDIDGVNYLIERVLYRKSIGVRRGSYFVVLFGAENISDGSRVAATENWKLQYGEALFAPEWSLSTAAAQAFPGRTYHAPLDPRGRQKMCAVFETPPEVYPDLAKNKTSLFILIPNISDGVDERIEVKME